MLKFPRVRCHPDGLRPDQPHPFFRGAIFIPREMSLPAARRCFHRTNSPWHRARNTRRSARMLCYGPYPSWARDSNPASGDEESAVSPSCSRKNRNGKGQPFPPVQFRNSASGMRPEYSRTGLKARRIQCAVESILAKAATHILESKNSTRKVQRCWKEQGCYPMSACIFAFESRSIRVIFKRNVI